MIIVILLIGVILVVAAIRNSQGALFSALAQDVPAFVVWAAAIFALGSIGFVPGLRPVSRGLLALVLVVLVLRNYKEIISGFNNAWQNPPAAAPTVKETLHTGTILDTISGIAALSPGPDHTTGVTGAF